MDRRAQKADIRKQVLAKRDRLDAMRRIELSLQAADYGIRRISLEPGTIVSGFFPIRSEIDPRPLMDMLRQKGARLCLPVILDKTTIAFRELVRGTELIDTGFGTRGPSPDAPILDPQILIMPLAAFDGQGGRIGYGAGHYDRAIARLKEKGMMPKLYGFAFACQQVPEVPVESHDQPLDVVITENGVVECD